MTTMGIFQKVTENGQLKRFRDVRFVSTGVKNNEGKIIWRKLSKDGTPTNVFAEQFEPNTPYAFGKWFCKINGATVLRVHPQLKVETETSKSMTNEEYLAHLESHFYGTVGQ